MQPPHRHFISSTSLIQVPSRFQLFLRRTRSMFPTVLIHVIIPLVLTKFSINRTNLFLFCRFTLVCELRTNRCSSGDLKIVSLNCAMHIQLHWNGMEWNWGEVFSFALRLYLSFSLSFSKCNYSQIPHPPRISCYSTYQIYRRKNTGIFFQGYYFHRMFRKKSKCAKTNISAFMMFNTKTTVLKFHIFLLFRWIFR